MEELRIAPRTVSLLQFAAARAPELLSLHSVLKSRKRKASTEEGAVSDTHDDGDCSDAFNGRIDGAGLCRTRAPFSRHLRRRTSCYLRRRLPLPWQYKKKRIRSSSLPVHHKRRRRQRQKEPPDNTSNVKTQHCAVLTLGLGSDKTVGSDTGVVSISGPSSGPTLENEVTMSEADSVASLENGAAANAPMQLVRVPSILKTDDFSNVPSAVTRLNSMLQSVCQGDLEDVASHLSHEGNGSIVQMREEKINTVASAAAQREFQSETDCVLPVDVGGVTSLAQENKQDFGTNGENRVCSSTDNASMLICHSGQEGSINQVRLEEDCAAEFVKNPALGPFDPQEKITTEKKKLCRTLRRLLEFKPGGTLIASDGTRRLETHLWHAKRFTISKLWGYCIPIGRHGRGCGSRAILRWSKSKALLHDRSFNSAIQLVGKQESIIHFLRPVLQLPRGIDLNFGAKAEESFLGRCFTTAILHHVSSALQGVISPVLMMWKPDTPEVTSCQTEKIAKSSQVRSLWLWVHAGAFEEAYRMLKSMCLPLNDQSNGDKVVCVSRKGDLGCLDLVGEGSLAVLKKVLFPVQRDPQGKVVKVEQLLEVLNPDQKGKAITYLEVADPRLRLNEHCLALDPSDISPVVVFDDRACKSITFMEDSNKNAEAGEKHEQETSNTICGDVWKHPSDRTVDALWLYGPDTSSQLFERPLKEKYLSRKRHIDRLDTFGLTKVVRSNRTRERKNLSCRFVCPIILVKHEYECTSMSGWSLIMPMTWILAFWVPLVLAGGHVIGIRERHWLYTDAGCAAFPEDFPDCKAYSEMKAESNLQLTQSAHKEITDVISKSSEQILLSSQKAGVEGQLVQQDVVKQLIVKSTIVPCTVSELDHGCYVARSADQLVSFLKTTHQTGLLLFPLTNQPLAKFHGLGNRLRKGTVVWHPKPHNLQSAALKDQSVCLLRVCLRPFYRGVVKVGAKLHAPTLDDYFIWSSKEKVSGDFTSGVRGVEKALGFVTSMAPRGSKVPAAIAFCDAVALGLARQQQWIHTTWHKTGEVFLMFCNDGSSLRRPAFGSICLEAGRDI